MTVNEEVAKILIERVVKRLLLMAEITHVEVCTIGKRPLRSL